MRSGCADCGARAVGEPLARPEHELPAYGRALLVGVIGAFTVLLFLVVTIVALIGRPESTFSFSSLVTAAEIGAWRLKWLGFPLALMSVWLSWRVHNSIRKEPVRFMGARFARGGLMASVLFALLMTTLVGVTVPERLRQRKMSAEAAYRARLYTHNRAFLEYRARFGTFPTDLNDLRNLPDENGSIAELITQAERTSYKPWTELAATQPVPVKSNGLRGAAIEPATLSAGADDSPSEGVPFTNYELRLPGEDKILGTNDDWLMRDGMIEPVAEIESGSTRVPIIANAP